MTVDPAPPNPPAGPPPPPAPDPSAAEAVAGLAGAIDERLGRQIRFVLEADRLKTVLRQSYVGDDSRRENSAEHSWHLALFALVLADRARERIDVARVVEMLVLHDLVEIDAGDNFLYDDEAMAAKEAAEAAAADRLFGLLPDDLGAELRATWDEFEARRTPEARFAYALDRLQPMLANLATSGQSWRHHGVRASQVRDKCGAIVDGSPLLWELGQAVIDTATEAHLLRPG